ASPRPDRAGPRRKRARSDRKPWPEAFRARSLRRSLCDPSTIAGFTVRLPRASSLGVVEDDSQRVAAAGSQAADAMAPVDAVRAAPALHGSMMHGDDPALAVRERHHFRPRLHPRPLLREHEFAAGEILARPRQQKSDLQRENVLAVEILMQAI